MNYVDSLKRYEKELTARGFVRMTLTASPALVDTVVANRRRGESPSQCVERLVCGSNEARPSIGALRAALSAEEGAEQRERERLVKRTEKWMKDRGWKPKAERSAEAKTQMAAAESPTDGD